MMKFAVLGHPIKHSLSPVMHQASFASIGFDGSYEKIDVPPDVLMDRLQDFKADGFSGVNITIPLKEIAFQNLTTLDESAKLLGSVNTVKFTEDGMVGYCTDGFGLLMAIEENFGVTVEGKNLFFIGCGGAGRATALTAATAGAKSITLSDCDENRVNALAKEINAAAPSVEIFTALTDSEKLELCPKADIVINATPIGMKESDPSPLPVEAFRENQCVFDMIYMYPETSVMKAAKQAGAKVANGIGMLVNQGAKSFEIWTGVSADAKAMAKAVCDSVYN